MNCKHKFKVHETYYASATSTGTAMEKRATVVCEKCGRVQDVVVEVYPSNQKEL